MVGRPRENLSRASGSLVPEIHLVSFDEVIFNALDRTAVEHIAARPVQKVPSGINPGTNVQVLQALAVVGSIGLSLGSSGWSRSQIGRGGYRFRKQHSKV
jgi:hypothetical protein